MQKYENDDFSRYAGPESQQLGEAQIYEDAMEAVLNALGSEAGDVEIQVMDGVITLTGMVDGRENKRRAEVCLENIAGVRDIMNLLRLSEFCDDGEDGLVKKKGQNP